MAEDQSNTHYFYPSSLQLFGLGFQTIFQWSFSRWQSLAPLDGESWGIYWRTSILRLG